MGQQENRNRWYESEVFNDVVTVLVVVFWLTVVAGFIWLIVYSFRSSPTLRVPDYMVSITGVDGLNLETTSGGVPTTLSPVFNLMVRIDNSGYTTRYRACVWGLSTAVVSYGDAFLARGSVPPFCTEGHEVQERMATAWGEDVVLPRFLRERLSAELERGEASLEVQVTGCSQCSDNEVLVCRKVKIGGGSSPCRVERVYVQPAPAGGSTSSSQI